MNVRQKSLTQKSLMQKSLCSRLRKKSYDSKKIHIAYIVKGSLSKVVNYGLASDKTGCIDTWGKRAPSRHAEASCLCKFNHKKMDRSYKIVSLAFSHFEGSFKLSMAKPCLDCSRNILRHGIKTVYYSNYQGHLVRCNSKDLVNNAELSTGFLIRQKLSFTPKIYLRKLITLELIKNGLKTIEIRKFSKKGFFSKLTCGTFVDFIVRHEGKTHILHALIIRLKRYANFRNLLIKEGMDKSLPLCKNIGEGVNWLRNYYRKTDSEGVLAIEFKLVKN